MSSSSRRRRRMQRRCKSSYRGNGRLCWYCRTVTIVSGDTTHPRFRTVEHLIPKSAGGDNQPDNLRFSCRQCNVYVGNWDIELKVRFRYLIRNVGGWPGIRKKFNNRNEVESHLLDMYPPVGEKYDLARQVKLRIDMANLNKDMLDAYEKRKVEDGARCEVVHDR